MLLRLLLLLGAVGPRGLEVTLGVFGSWDDSKVEIESIAVELWALGRIQFFFFVSGLDFICWDEGGR